MVLKTEVKISQRHTVSYAILRQAPGILLVSLASVRELKLKHRPVASYWGSEI
jgi:hypothetical protein